MSCCTVSGGISSLSQAGNRRAQYKGETFRMLAAQEVKGYESTRGQEACDHDR
jgi:hypothetical protein